MTDRELLELAAKAAGIERGEERTDCGISTAQPDGRHGYLPRWDPLTDDGDALRLAVNLSLIICSHRHGESWVQRLAIIIKEPHGKDANAATRRAIVRAAAEIGRIKHDTQ